jgi:hypothetical protein
MEHYAKQGVFAGELDSIELEQLKGQIKELKYIMKLIEVNKITGIIHDVD